MVGKISSPENAVAKTARPYRWHGLQVLPAGFERNLLCGLAIIAGIDSRTAIITLHTPVVPRRIRVLQFGDLRVTPDGREI